MGGESRIFLKIADSSPWWMVLVLPARGEFRRSLFQINQRSNNLIRSLQFSQPLYLFVFLRCLLHSLIFSSWADCYWKNNMSNVSATGTITENKESNQELNLTVWTLIFFLSSFLPALKFCIFSFSFIWSSPADISSVEWTDSFSVTPSLLADCLDLNSPAFTTEVDRNNIPSNAKTIEWRLIFLQVIWSWRRSAICDCVITTVCK